MIDVIVVHIGHVDHGGIFLVDEDIGLLKLDALVMALDLHLEVLGETAEELLPIDVGVMVLGPAGQDEKRPEEVQQNCMREWQFLQQGVD